jgi:hypothetical protein
MLGFSVAPFLTSTLNLHRGLPLNSCFSLLFTYDLELLSGLFEFLAALTRNEGREGIAKDSLNFCFALKKKKNPFFYPF